VQTNSYPGQTDKPAARFRSVVIVGSITLFVLVGFYWDGVTKLLDTWSREEYSHGYLVAPIALFLLLRGLGSGKSARDQGAWSSFAICLLAVALGIFGTLGHIAIIIQYGLIVALVAFVVALVGARSALGLWAPLLYLAFMVPLPQFVYLKLSATMQLISSELGVGLIRLVGIPVFLEGNVIDLGIYKLLVAEACSGLRYLFPLISFGFLFAVLYRGPWWHRAILFLATVPITILMNSFRVGMIGIIVDRYGIEQAEGFLHYFEGWIIFIACVALLFGIAYVLTRLGGTRRSLGEILDFGFERLGDGARRIASVSNTRPLIVVCGLFLLGLAGLHALPSRANITLDRVSFVTFPSTLDRWQGRQFTLDPKILEVLNADDYLMAKYVTDGSNAWINFYMTYYADQTDGRAVHSPEVCIPGSGWEIASLEQKTLSISDSSDKPLTLSRAIIQNGTSRRLVYFWFEGRGRQLTNEYLVKWYILWDGITKGRSDGSLVRFITPIYGQDGTSAADERLTEFLGNVYPRLSEYIPR